jgi:hypothetical protein
MPKGVPKPKTDKELVSAFSKKDLMTNSPKHNAAVRGAMSATLRRLTTQNPKRLNKIAEALLDAAEAGDLPAIKEVFDRLDGKAVQSTEITGADGGNVKVDFAGELAVALAGDILKLRQDKSK